jgi:hypothetical protein
MEFEGGSAFASVSASILGPAPVGEPVSKGGPQAEFDVPDRITAPPNKSVPLARGERDFS